MPGIGIGIGITAGVGRSVSLFNRVHQELFGAGEQGIYMPSVHESFLRGDLYQDAIGTTPVTAAGQPVGLWLDRSKGLALGPELITNGDFSNGTTGWTPTQSTILVVDGELETTATSSNWGQAGRSVNLTPGKSYVLSGHVTKGTAGQRASIDIYDGEVQFTAINASSGEASGAVVFVAKGSGNCVLKLNSWVTEIGQKSYFDNISIRELPGNHASQPTAASRPTLQQDANGMYVLRFDGVDDSMVTPNIDFTGTDQMTVLAGFAVGKIDLYTHIVNLGNGLEGAIPGGFWAYLSDTGRPAITVRGSTTPNNAYAGKRSQSSSTVTVGSPAILVGGIASIGASYDAVASVITCRPAVTTAFENIGTLPLSGTFGTLPLFIGRQFTRPFNGDIYGLIVAGAEKTLAQIERAENLINKYTRAY